MSWLLVVAHIIVADSYHAFYKCSGHAADNSPNFCRYFGLVASNYPDLSRCFSLAADNNLDSCYSSILAALSADNYSGSACLHNQPALDSFIAQYLPYSLKYHDQFIHIICKHKHKL